MSASHLLQALPNQLDLRCDVMVKPDAAPIRFLLTLQSYFLWRICHQRYRCEKSIPSPEAISREGIPLLPNSLANGTN
jgi:hypothetical protein